MGIKRAEIRRMISNDIRGQAQEGEPQGTAGGEKIERTET